jgi:hypothetical protein
VPTSSKVQFNLEDLRRLALEAIDERIQAASDELHDLESNNNSEVARSEWRSRQETRVQTQLSEFFSL